MAVSFTGGGNRRKPPQQHINNFTTLLTGLVQHPPSVDTNLMDMLDLTSIMKSLEGMFQDPQS
jgi:hypothetical protein